jgi:hypothetical protein
MSDYFDTVEQELRHALRRHAHLPWYARLRLRHPRTLVAAVACFVIGGPALAVALGVLNGQPSAPTSGRFTTPNADSSVAALGYQITVTPNLQAGAVGWCVSDRTFAERGGGGSRGCAPAPSPSSPVVIAGGSDFTSHRPGLTATTTSTVYLTTARVAAVRVSRSLAVLTRSDAQIPPAYRIAILVHQTITHGRPQRPITVHVTAVALDRAGNQIGSPASNAPSAVPHEASTFWTRGEPTGPSTEPLLRMPPPAACEIDTSALQGATPFFGSVVAHVRGFSTLAGDSYVSCADTHFAYRGLAVVAAILLDAQDPGEAPALLPAATPVAQHPQTYTQPLVTPSSNSHPARSPSAIITARRLGNAWLIVQADGTLPQRLAILDRLSTCVRLNGPKCPTP